MRSCPRSGCVGAEGGGDRHRDQAPAAQVQALPGPGRAEGLHGGETTVVVPHRRLALAERQDQRLPEQPLGVVECPLIRVLIGHVTGPGFSAARIAGGPAPCRQHQPGSRVRAAEGEWDRPRPPVARMATGGLGSADQSWAMAPSTLIRAARIAGSTAATTPTRAASARYAPICAHGNTRSVMPSSLQRPDHRRAEAGADDHAEQRAEHRDHHRLDGDHPHRLRPAAGRSPAAGPARGSAPAPTAPGC